MSSDEAHPPVYVGEIIADKYRVENILGRGGMGVVVAAQHMQLGQRVAVKFLLVDPHQSPDAVERFLREARAAVRIQSEHVARVIDVGTLVTGAPYMVMEYLVGCDLAALIQREGAQPIPRVVDLVLQACEAIAEAHAKGIIHRDLKPANLFLTQRPDGTSLVKVLDFGISKSSTLDELGTPQVSLTATSTVIGSPLYMSPEQMRSAKHVDARSDIWSLGVILFELLTGRPVYEAESLPGLCAMIASDPAPPLSSLRADAPRELERIIDACLSKNPSRRPQTVAELANALAPFGTEVAQLSARRVQGVLAASSLRPPREKLVSEHATTVNIGQVASGHVPGDAGRTADGWGTTAQQRTKTLRGAWFLGGAAIFVVVGATVLALWAPWRIRGVEVAVPVADDADAALSAGVSPAPPPSAVVPTMDLPSASASASVDVPPPPPTQPAASLPGAPRTGGKPPSKPPPPKDTGASPSNESDVLNERR